MKGFYTVKEAATLSHAHTRSVKMWIKGYQRYGKQFPALFEPAFNPINDEWAVDFMDLMEIRAINAFQNAGVQSRVIRELHDKAKITLGSDHPFASGGIKTDGKELFYDEYISLKDDQVMISEVIQAYIKNIDFEGLTPVSWWPLSRDGGIVLDPNLNNGKPTLSECGYTTKTIVEHCQHHTEKEVAYWYELDIAEVRKALLFDKYLRSENVA